MIIYNATERNKQEGQGQKKTKTMRGRAKLPPPAPALFRAARLPGDGQPACRRPQSPQTLPSWLSGTERAYLRH